MLPTEVVKRSNVNANVMVIYAHPKAGKTQAISGLNDNLIIDLEDGSSYVDGKIINVLKIASERMGLSKPKEVLKSAAGLDMVLTVLREVSLALAEKKVVYDYISIDTVTALIEIATRLATLQYKATVIGKNYTGNNVVMDLPSGGGYEFLRQAFKQIVDSLNYATKCVLLIGHVKDASIPKMNGDISAKDIALTGKLKMIVCSAADAIGYLYRKDGTKTILSFKSDERDLATGARPPHLANKDFVLVEEKPAGSREFEYHWNEIFV